MAFASQVDSVCLVVQTSLCGAALLGHGGVRAAVCVAIAKLVLFCKAVSVAMERGGKRRALAPPTDGRARAIIIALFALSGGDWEPCFLYEKDKLLVTEVSFDHARAFTAQQRARALAGGGERDRRRDR